MEPIDSELEPANTEFDGLFVFLLNLDVQFLVPSGSLAGCFERAFGLPKTPG